MAVPSSLVVRLNVKRLLVVLLVAVPPLALDVFLVLDHTRQEFTSQAGGYLQALADNGARRIGYFVKERVVDLETIALSHQLRETVRAPIQERVADELLKVNEGWNSSPAAPLLSRVLGNPTSVFLRDYLTLNPAFIRLLVTNRAGETVAASHKPDLYYHGDQVWWINSVGRPHGGRIDITGAHQDPVSLTAAIALSVPIQDPTSAQVRGVIRGFVAVERLVSGLELGDGSQVLVVDRKAKIIASTQPAAVFADKEGFLPVLERILENQDLGPSRIRARTREPALVGFANIGLPTIHPEIDWFVVVARDWNAMSAPIRAINLRALASGFLAIFLLAAVAAYFTVHRPENLDSLEELHEQRK